MMVKMAEKIAEHPLLLYLTFILPMALLALGIIFKANVFLLIIVTAWLGVAIILLFLPIESDVVAPQ